MSDSDIFDYASFPVLETERLVLREVNLDDAADVLVFRSDPYVQRYNGPVYESIEEAEELIKWLQNEYAQQEGLSWGVTLRDEGKVMGLFGLHQWSRYHRRALVGYDMARAYWGRGFATEALRAILAFAFERMDLHRIHTVTIADNHESVRLLKRLGFVQEGQRREHSWEDDGTFHDSAIFGLLHREFKE